MPDSNDLLDHARRAFQLAAKMPDGAEMRVLAEIGMTYLRMAHEDAALFDANEERHALRAW